MKLLLILPLIAATVSAKVVIEEWEAWKLAYGQNYSSPAEERFRLMVFMENKYKIIRHNYEAHRGQHTYFLKMNEFGDLLHHEFVQQKNGYRMDLKEQSPGGATFISPANVELPDEVDWRTKGAVTPVKNQDQCGSCWAFSATGALEGQHFRKEGELISLSEQNLIDCSEIDGNSGCSGGTMDFAFQYVKENHGIDTEAAYPYEAIGDDCHYQPRNRGATDVGFVDLPKNDEQKLKGAVATVGPVSVAIDASRPMFQFYSHGIYDDKHCHTSIVDHAVLVVGYGTDNGSDYWLVKNSWGHRWGESGYIRMSRNKGNQCGIASMASYPLV